MSAPPLRWLLVGDGASVHIRRLARGLAEAGVDTHLASFGGGPIDGVAQHRLRGPSSDMRYALVVPQLRTLVRRLQPDVLNPHYLSSYGLAGALVGHKMLVQTVWGSDLLITARRQPRRAAAEWALRRARLATGCSLELLHEVEGLAPGLPVHRFIWAPPRAVSAHARLEEPIVLSLRLLEPLYQVDVILNAWRLAAPRLAGVRLIVASGGSQMDELRRRGGAGVEFTGQVDHRRMLDIVARARVAVSIPRSDASSAAVLEALASGCRVVATDTEAMRELVAPNRLVPIDVTPSALADAIVDAYVGEPSVPAPWDFESQVETLVEAVQRATGTSGTRTPA